MRTNLHVLAATLCIAVSLNPVQAQGLTPPPVNVVSLSATATVELARDWLTVVFSTTREATDAASVVLGVRPEDLGLLAADDPAAAVAAEVFAFELTGDATLVTIKHGDLMVTAKADKNYRSAMGARVGFSASAERCHLFDAGTQARMPTRPAT